MSTLKNRFQLQKLLGDGATAKVYLLWDDRLKRRVAVKQGENKELLLQEAQYLAALRSPYFPVLYDCTQEKETVSLYMEYIQGENLRERLLRIGRFTEREVLWIACRIAEAVRVLHKGEPPSIYGDIKPENIIMQPDGAIRLVDLGAAAPIEKGKSGKQSWSVRGATPFFAAPEMWQGGPDERSDIFALGRLMRALLAADGDREISRELYRIIDRCTQKAKEARYQTMDQFLTAAGECIMQ